MCHRADHCLNCRPSLPANLNFCPECGQENTSRQLSIKILIAGFLNNYFAFDSKLGRSVYHFFMRPGYLTRRFNEGKRVSYVHPLRLYLVISVLFFFMLSYLLSLQLEESSIQRISKEGTFNSKLQGGTPGKQVDSLALAEFREAQQQNPEVLALSDSISAAADKFEGECLKSN